MAVDELTQTRVLGEGHRKEQPGIGHQAGWLRGSIYWVLLFWDRLSVSKTIIPEAQEHLPVSSEPRYTPSFGGFGGKRDMDMAKRHWILLRALLTLLA